MGGYKVQNNIKIQLGILVLILISVVLVTLDFLIEFSPSQRDMVYTIDFIICIVLAAEFAYRLKTSRNRVKFLKNYWYELFALIPAYVFSLLELHLLSVPARSLRFIRVFRVIRILRVGVLYTRILKFSNTVWAILLKSKIPYLLILALSTILASTIAIYNLEHSVPNSSIKTVFDAFWWTLTTLTTVGYGDIVPVTSEGRIVGIILMIFGISIWTATISLLTVTLVEKKYKTGENIRIDLITLIQQYSGNIDELAPEDRTLLAKLIELTSKFTEFDSSSKEN
ncbi:ion transporter [Thermococcus sp.]